MTTTALSVVIGAGGFIGGHLVQTLVRAGHRVRAVDLRPLDAWHQRDPGADAVIADVGTREGSDAACSGATTVYQLAADMGGIGFIARHKARCMLSVLSTTNMLVAARDAGVSRFFFSSSACVYNVALQRPGGAALREEDAYPAMPEDGYGWEKLFSERMCRHFREDFGLETRVARYHNVYGPHGEWTGGREKAPAAICRKVAEAVLGGGRTIEIWGDGTQERSFTYVDDCVAGSLAITASDIHEPLNLGSSQRVTIDQLVDAVESVAGVTLDRVYRPLEPTGVAARNSDNTRIRAELGWAPSVCLADGLARTYAWVHDEVARSRRT